MKKIPTIVKKNILYSTWDMNNFISNEKDR